ncbi:MAG: MMPL family transporter [Chloroflexi bacterium]|nr:MMPL family transporter [Chloroflexota bacterium]MCY3938999.1 MMPL family transporter [Chloroflexota bacterium]
MSIRLAGWLERNSSFAIAFAVVATVLLAVPFLLMTPTESASGEPGGEVFETLEKADERFASRVFGMAFIVEAADGDLLRKDALEELLTNAQAVRDDPEIGPKLFSYFDPDRNIDVVGVYTVADSIDALLRAAGVDGIAAASDAEVRTEASDMVDRLGPRELGLSVESRKDPATGHWIVPALVMNVLVDNEAVGGGGVRAVVGSDDTSREEFARDVQARLRGDERHLSAWGIAIDVNLTSEEQGGVAGPFIGFTIFAVLVVVGIAFHSYWTVAIIGAALAAMIIWLKGLSNLVGLKDALILDLIVPIAMISFGVDFAIHAIGRYREERRVGNRPHRAFVAGFGAVLAALLVAFFSDAVAFLANVSSRIESVIQFGVGAAFGVLSGFLMLGVVAPLALMRVEQRVGFRRESRLGRFIVTNAMVAAGLAVMASVIFSVYLNPTIGVVILGGYVVVFLAAPYLAAGWLGADRPVDEKPKATGVDRLSRGVGNGVALLARVRKVLLPVAALLTAGAVYLAIQLPLESDVKVFFSPDTDFVTSLDKLDRHIGSIGGEPAEVYVEGDLTSPDSIAAIHRFADAVRGLDTELLARDEEGLVTVDTGAARLLGEVLDSQAARAAISSATGVSLSDDDNDRIPDSREQLAAVYAFTREAGVPFDESRLAWTPDLVRRVLWESDDRSVQSTKLTIQLLGSRAQENIHQVRTELSPLVDQLQDDLRDSYPDASAVLSGAPVARQATLDAVARALQISLPIAVVLCLIVAAVFTRSIRFAFVGIIPILLVVAWLYGFMYVFGYGINLVTATIGAISIGIGIDFAIHFTMRYREELFRHGVRIEAIRAAGGGTGVALIASALSSVIGFAILAFAPMPMFASYGLLTAVMIVMAAASSLIVLPSLLMVVTRDREPMSTVPQEPATAG